MPQIQGPLPTILHSTKPVALSVAKNWLSAYTTLSESSPQYHPNSTFTPDRLEFSSHGPEGGITMHLLRRIIAGLSGEVLEPMKEEDAESDDRVLDSQITPVQDARGKKREFNHQTTEGEWEDPDIFAGKQGEEGDVGEIGERANFVAEVSEEPEVHADAVDNGVKAVSKEDRKAAKKAKRQAEKREKNEKAKKVKI
ncbi:hypothetical protein E2P81_ATG00043 [Venturia nashicola]|uniref:Uncharacterized protein n=1 Tax=Venturia nashicola TaxID=86259 RepID=A0A4Z1PCN9_9PEZI|nr:hypothetical protein E6O75_ATG00048 [Venturia nashicola]TLD39056.1 hypothetical protein E2P81_ATG00043 [Venturia nashicola]